MTIQVGSVWYVHCIERFPKRSKDQMKLVCPPEASEVQKLDLRISVLSTGDCIVLLFLLEDEQASFDFVTSCETPLYSGLFTHSLSVILVSFELLVE